MATYNNGQDMSYVAAADYSSTGQERWMTLDASEQAELASTRGEPVVGALQDNPDSGYPGIIRKFGSTRIVAGGTAAVGEAGCTDANGAVVQATLPTDYVVCRFLEDAVSGRVVEVLITHEGRAEGAKAWSEDFNALDTTDQVANIQPDGTVADGTGDVLNHCYTPGGNVLCYEALGTQTILGPVMVAAGLDIGGDQTDNDGWELFSHFLGASGRPFVIGKDPAFYLHCKIELTTADGTDDLQVGFRRAEICRPNWDDYLDAAAIGIITAASPAAVQLQTIIGNAATTETDTTDTWASALAVEFKILVSAAGVVTYQHDIAAAGTLAAPTTVAAFTFDNGDPVIPFVRFLNANAAQVGNVIIHKWEAGYQ